LYQAPGDADDGQGPRRRGWGAELEIRAVTTSDPAEELATMAEHLDLLVVGSRAYGPSGRLLSGSTSMGLARRVACPLLVVPRP
jgi:nucleotide-binding universal stress UspA family protein